MPFDKNYPLPMAQTVTPGRVCYFCKHIYMSNGDPGYSEYTPGYDMSLNCGKGYWNFDTFDDSLTVFREQLQAAEHCADFTENT